MMLDGTLCNSYFERFHNIWKNYGQLQNSKSVFIETIIRKKEVNYERFSSSYWPHFNAQLARKLDPSRVFTEIISHIKGGLQSIEVVNGKLNREDYVNLSETRNSSLSRQKRERIYDIFESYEQMKMRNGEFDLADLVNDLHHRLKEESYKGDEFHFVYIDEVQDLTMSQVALFKYVCKNIEEGFVFSGDTAQTIARGIDFRFQDIRSLFYKKFVLESRNNGNDGRQEKRQLSDIFNLRQNFRTHVGVLNLAQSIIELLYRFFPHSVDILKPETSLIYGEPPILLESGDEENAILKIFGNTGEVGGNMVGFGAEQVILVRDDCVRKEISNYVGKQALVLTIVESKGLEFQVIYYCKVFITSGVTRIEFYFYRLYSCYLLLSILLIYGDLFIGGGFLCSNKQFQKCTISSITPCRILHHGQCTISMSSNNKRRKDNEAQTQTVIWLDRGFSVEPTSTTLIY